MFFGLLLRFPIFSFGKIPTVQPTHRIRTERKGATVANNLVSATSWHDTVLGAIAPFLSREGLTDLIIGPAGTIWAETATRPGLHRLSHHSFSEEDCRELAVSLAQSAGTRLDDAHPWAAGYLQWDEHLAIQLHAVLPAIAPHGTTISLRLLRPAQHSLNDLLQRGMVSSAQCAELVQHLENKHSMLITGATGSGKQHF